VYLKFKNNMSNNKKQFQYQHWQVVALCASIFLIGCLSGFLCSNLKSSQRVYALEKVLNVLDSQVVPSITSYGRVTDINGNKITIAFNEDAITVTAKDGVRIQTLGSGRSAADLSQIKIGDMLNVDITVESDGSFVANSIMNFSGK